MTARADAGEARAPAATIAVCTRDRPEQLAAALSSILRVAPEDVPVLVVDQGDVPALEGAPAGGGRVRYHRDHGRGLSRARNVALSFAAGEIVVFVDDDCALRPGAVERLLEAFEDEAVAVAFGRVDAPESDGGFIPTYAPARRRVLRGRAGKLRDGGIGALMAVRRDVAVDLGGFDERLGAGAALASCEDGEFAYRALKAGYALAHVPDAVVDHYGFRAWHEGGTYAYRTYRAIGAAYALHLGTGDAVAAALLAQQAYLVAREMAGAAFEGRRPVGLRKLAGLATGAWAGLRMGVWDGAHATRRGAA